MERWSAIPTEDEILNVRAAGANSSGNPLNYGCRYLSALSRVLDERRKDSACKAWLYGEVAVMFYKGYDDYGARSISRTQRMR